MGGAEEPAERKFVIRTPGKLIITGEHAVVYGKLALAASIDLRTEFHLIVHPRPVDSPLFAVHFENLDFETVLPLDKLPDSSCSDSSLFDSSLLEGIKNVIAAYVPSKDQSIEMSLCALCYLYCSIVKGGSRHSFELRIRSEIPIGAGLGSSAAFSVAASGAFHLLRHLIGSSGPFEADPEAINGRALQCERMFHATPSGIDNAVCTYGGVVKFQKTVVGSLAVPEARILLVNTGKSRQTRLLVEGVRKKRDQFPSVVEPILEAIDRISHEMTGVVVEPPEDSYRRVQELLTTNHWLLASLGVSHATLDDIHRIARANGQAAKLTGAGGGGLAFVWLDPRCTEEQLNALKAELQANDPPYQFWPARLGVKGLDIQEIV